MTSAHDSLGAASFPLPENLTHCCVCGLPFPGPVDDWDDYFAEVEDASFACGPCLEREGFDAAE